MKLANIVLIPKRIKQCVPCLVLLLNGCGNEMLTLEQAKNQYYAVRVEDVEFNVPVLYHPLEGSLQKGWAAPKPERETIDSIRIVALLSDLDYYHENTAQEFKVLGYGKKVRILMSHYRVNWPYYFDGAYKRLIKLPEHPELPGMFHYRDPLSDMKDVFLSHEQPVRELTKIICDNPDLDPYPAPSPSCRVTTLYRHQFMLYYTYSLDFLEQWREIDRKVKALLDSFIPGNSQA